MLLERAQHLAERRAFEIEGRKIRPAHREGWRLPALRQGERTPPIGIVGGRAARRPCQQHLRGKRVCAEPVQQPLGRALLRQRRVERLARAEREHGLLGIGQLEPRRKPRRVFRHEHRKRGEPENRVRRARQRRLDGDQMREPAKPRRAAENVDEKPVVEQGLDRFKRLRRDSGFVSARRTPARLKVAPGRRAASRTPRAQLHRAAPCRNRR